MVYRETGEILDDSETLCSQMDPPGVFKMLLEKKFKVKSVLLSDNINDFTCVKVKN